jgi:SAM-dependent methyltransferase
MTLLPFKNKFDFIYSAFDSVNYLNDEAKLSTYFANISKNINEDGLLLFDVSLKNNSLKYVKRLNRKGSYKGIKYIQKSVFDEESKIHSNFIKLKLSNGKIIEEIHKQKIYDFYYYFEVLESNNLYVVECFEAFTFNDATEDSERVQFIVKRK